MAMVSEFLGQLSLAIGVILSYIQYIMHMSLNHAVYFKKPSV